MPSVYLLLGSNMGNRVTNIRQSILLLVDEGLELLQVSHFYETDAWGVEEQAPFLNVCAKFKTDIPPANLLKLVKKIEKKIGRIYRDKWHQREIDIDIIYYGKKVVNETDLQIPHPLLIKRNFALLPLREIARRKKHPVLKLSTSELCKLCTDDKKVHKLRYQPKVFK